MDFAGFLIYCGSKLLLVSIFASFLLSFIYLLFNKNYRGVIAPIIFIAVVIFYFVLITGPTAIGGGRTKAPINGLIFIFAVFGFYKCLEFLRKKTI